MTVADIAASFPPEHETMTFSVLYMEEKLTATFSRSYEAEFTGVHHYEVKGGVLLLHMTTRSVGIPVHTIDSFAITTQRGSAR